MLPGMIVGQTIIPVAYCGCYIIRLKNCLDKSPKFSNMQCQFMARGSGQPEFFVDLIFRPIIDKRGGDWQSSIGGLEGWQGTSYIMIRWKQKGGFL